MQLTKCLSSTLEALSQKPNLIAHSQSPCTGEVDCLDCIVSLGPSRAVVIPCLIKQKQSDLKAVTWRNLWRGGSSLFCVMAHDLVLPNLSKVFCEATHNLSLVTVVRKCPEKSSVETTSGHQGLWPTQEHSEYWFLCRPEHRMDECPT